MARSRKTYKKVPTSIHQLKQYKDWRGFKDFLNQKKVEWLPFEEAREFARSLGLKNLDAWIEYCKSGKKPNDIPACPYRVYKGKGWKGSGDFLGTGNVHTKEFRSFEEAREFAQSLNL